MAADEDMEDVDIKDFIKMEIADIEQEEVENNNWSLEYDSDAAAEQLIKNLSPVVYTTKLDDMNTMNMNLEELDAREITTMLLTESKPTFTPTSKQTPLGTENLQSYLKLANVVYYINFKAKRQRYNTNIRNLKLLKQCKPFCLALKDIKKSTGESKTTLVGARKNVNILKNVSRDPFSATIDSSSNEKPEVQVKIEALDSDFETSQLQVKIEVIDSDSKKKNQVLSNIEVIELSDIDESQHMTKEIEIFERKSQQENTKKIESQSEKPVKEPSAKKIATVKKQRQFGKKIKRRKPSQRASSTSSDDDNISLINMKSKTVVAPLSTKITTEKFALVVLQSKNDEESFVYRFNASRLITDYYVATEKDKLFVATMFPREEKTIEQYCCWFKREEIISKICMRKNYSFTIQKFLRQPHSCRSGYCQCCCSNKASNQNKESQARRQHIVNKSLNTANSWIRGLLNQNPPVTFSLVGRAMSYIPKIQVKEKPVTNEPEKYLEDVLLFINYTGPVNDNFKYFAELYEFGKNGNVVKSHLLNNQENSTHIRRTYSLLGLKCIDKQFCCWYAREKLMLSLRVSKVSPTALKLIQKPHICERHSCNCCCKPYTMPLKPIEALPKTLKHTSAYETNPRLLTIRFNIYTKFPIKTTNKTLIDIEKTPDRNILSTYANKKSIQELSTRILSKFKNLKLEVNSNGKLEAILDRPASNLSVEELKVLSDILALSTKQITELGLPAEEFCNRINTRIAPSNKDFAKKTIMIITPETIPPPLSPETYSSPEPVKSITPTGTLPKNITPVNDQVKNNKRTYAKEPITKQLSNMLSSISNLMETKNKNYVDSFKLFFKNNASTNVVIPKIRQYKLDEVTNTVKPVSMPKIGTSFTLSTSSSDAHGTAGPSGRSRTTRRYDTICSEAAIDKESPAIDKEMSNAEPKTTLETNINTRSATKRKESFNHTQSDKKIRVKSPSKLMPQTSDTAQIPFSTDNMPVKPLASWPRPIVIKREPYTNIQSIVSTPQGVGIETSPNLQTQGFILRNNVVTTPKIQLANTTAPVNNSTLKVYGNNNKTRLTAGTTSNANGGLCYLTLMPLNSNITASSNNQSLLAEILKTPQVQPTMMPGISNLPELVPIIPVNMGPTSAFKIVQISENSINQPVIVKNEIPDENNVEIDVENSIHCNVLNKRTY